MSNASDNRSSAVTADGWAPSKNTEGPNGCGYYTAGIDIPIKDDPFGPRMHYSAIEFHCKDKAEAERRRDAVLTALAQPQEAWQSIATAPKDGTKIDLLYPYPRGRTIDCMWREGGVDGAGRWVWLKPTWGSQPGLGIDWHLLPESEWEVCSYPNMEPTHWMRAPALSRPHHSSEGK